MKVNTDSMILGSWAEPGGGRHVVDIGTGTGILALMMAQKTAAGTMITGVEIDKDACQQAQENFDASPWANRMQVVKADVSAFIPATPVDCVISNPPYYAAIDTSSKAYSGLSAQRAAARVEQSLSPATLMTTVKRQLTDTGLFFCVYPTPREGIICRAATEAGLTLQSQLRIQASPQRKPYLTAFRFSCVQMSMKNAIPTEKLVIRDDSGVYTSEFRHLCREFYLKF